MSPKCYFETMGYRTRPLAMGPRERAQLEEWARSEKSPRRLIFRSKICLLAAQGVSNSQIAQRLNTSRATVRLWKRRFLEAGPDGLRHDAPRGPSPKKISERLRAEIVKAATRVEETPGFRWTTRSLAKALGVSNATVSRVWRSHGIGATRQRLKPVSVSGERETASSEIVGVYAAPSVVAVVTRDACKGINVAYRQGDGDRDANGSPREYRGETVGVDEAGADGPRMVGAVDIVEKIRFKPLDGVVGHENLRAFLEPFVRGGSSSDRSRILLFGPPVEVQSMVESIAASTPGMEVRVLPHAPNGDAGSETILCEQLESLRLRIEPRKLLDLLKAVNALTEQADLDREPLVWSSLCPTSRQRQAAETVSRTVRALGHYIYDLITSNGAKPRFLCWLGGNPMNWKQKLESFFAAAAFAEEGEHFMAREIALTPVPEVHESLGIVSGLSKAFVAAAFAEENCHDMAADFLAGAGARRSFLEEVGLVGVRVRYGLVSAERSFADMVGLSGVRYRVLTLQL
ncbi:MAG: helix-turn-helix domain-containing protein [Desulfomonilaceae bacterium]